MGGAAWHWGDVIVLRVKVHHRGFGWSCSLLITIEEQPGLESVGAEPIEHLLGWPGVSGS